MNQIRFRSDEPMTVAKLFNECTFSYELSGKPPMEIVLTPAQLNQLRLDIHARRHLSTANDFDGIPIRIEYLYGPR